MAEASNLALKAEEIPLNFSSLWRYSPKNNLESVADTEKSTTNRDSNHSNNIVQQSKAQT